MTQSDLHGRSLVFQLALLTWINDLGHMTSGETLILAFGMEIAHGVLSECRSWTVYAL